MNMIHWDPFRSLLDFPRVGLSADLEGAERSWKPVVDVFEQGDDIVIRAELPGVSKQDLSVSVEQGVLTLSGERKIEKELEEANAYRRERFFGKFTRGFTMPDSIDAEKISARFKDGVLEIRVPKADRVKPRTIEVDAA